MAERSLPVEHLFTMTLTSGKPGIIPGGPQGTRAVVNVTGGTFEGPKLKGTIESPAGDWVTSRADGTVKLDVRLLLQTDDGATILMTYFGVGAQKDGVMSLRSAPLFETGDPRYAWLNNVQAVGVGTSARGSVTYDVCALL